MTVPDSPHDKLFRIAFSDVRDAAAELRSVLPPDLAACLELNSLRPLPGTFVDAKMRGTHADQLYSVRCGDGDALL